MPKRQRLSGTASGDHFIRRDEQGRIKKEVAIGKSLAADRRTKAKTSVKPGHGDEGDQKPGARGSAAKKKAPATRKKAPAAKKKAPAKKK
jgi:hypothetical protein